MTMQQRLDAVIDAAIEGKKTIVGTVVLVAHEGDIATPAALATPTAKRACRCGKTPSSASPR